MPPTLLLHIFSPIKALHPVVRPCCVRFDSRWTPGYPPPRPKPRRPVINVPEDPKDYIPGWPEFKESLLRRCTSDDEIQMINELSPEEAQFLLDPGSAGKETGPLTLYRIMPANRNYFSGQAAAEQRVQDVEKLLEKYGHLPKAPPHVWPNRVWKTASLASPEDINQDAGFFDKGALRGSLRRSMINVGKELNKIHPVLMPPELKEWLDEFAPLRQEGTPGTRQKRMLDRFERSKGNGQRKTARAKAQVLPGEGLVYVNGKPAAEYFSRLKDVENVMWPLQALNVFGQYNIWVSTFGGGPTGMLFLKILKLMNRTI